MILNAFIDGIGFLAPGIAGWPAAADVLAGRAVYQPAPPVLTPPAVLPPAIPALPVQARQPKPPPICLPTCSAGLTRLRMELLDSLTSPPPQAKPASAATTR